MFEEKEKIELNELKEEYDAPQMNEQQLEMMKAGIRKAKMEKRRMDMNKKRKMVSAAAVAAVMMVALPNMSEQAAYAMSEIPVIGKLVDVVTFRDYQYEDERHKADVRVPELVPEQMTAEKSEGASETEKNAVSAEAKDAADQRAEQLQKSAEEINAEIRSLTDRIVTEFEADMKDQEGYQDVLVKHEIVQTGADYFTLRLICYQEAGSGSQWDYYYTIDLKTGERLALNDLFRDGADYITAISENIKDQMRARMAEDDSLLYWVDYTEVPEWNFEAITAETEFYVNAENNVVISFDEGEVAPMYMGVVTFEIPAEVTEPLRK